MFVPTGEPGAAVDIDAFSSSTVCRIVGWKKYGDDGLLLHPFVSDDPIVTPARDELEIELGEEGEADWRVRKFVGFETASMLDLVVGIEYASGDDADGEGGAMRAGVAYAFFGVAFEDIARADLHRTRWRVAFNIPTIFVGLVSTGGVWADSSDGSWTGDDGGWFIDEILVVEDSSVPRGIADYQVASSGAATDLVRWQLRCLYDSMDGSRVDICRQRGKFTWRVGFADSRYGCGATMGVDTRF